MTTDVAEMDAAPEPELRKCETCGQQSKNMSEANNQACQWKYCEHEYSWDTQCDNKYQFMNDGPKENDYKFCPGCGKPVTMATEIKSLNEKMSANVQSSGTDAEPDMERKNDKR